MIKFFVLLYVLILTASANAQVVDVIEYHNQEPFVLDEAEEKGFSFEVIRLLNELSEDIQFNPVVVPKARLILKLKEWIQEKCPTQPVSAPCEQDWVVLWTMPKWGWGKNPRQRYLWVPLFRDHDVIVTRRDSAIRYTNPNSLIGTRFGGLIGHTYNGIDELVAQGKIIREDASLEAALIHRVLLKRVDSVVVQGSAMKYLKRHILSDDKMNQLRISQPYFQEVQAEAMIPPGRQDVQFVFEQLIQSVAWQALLDRYDIEALVP